MASSYMGSFEMNYTLSDEYEKWEYLKVKGLKSLHMIFFSLSIIGLLVTTIAIPLIFIYNIDESFAYILMYIGTFIFGEIGLVIITKILDNYVSISDYDYIIYSVERDGGSIIVEERLKGVVEYELNGEKKMVNMVRFKPKQGKYLGLKKV